MRNKLSNTLWGLFFIVIGIGIAGRVMNLWEFEVFFEGWWTLLIIIPCFISMIQSGFGVGSTVGFLIGVLLFLSYRVDLNFSVWQLIVPAILIYIGLRFIFQSAFRKPIHIEKSIHVEGQQYSSGDKTEHSTVFSHQRIRVDNEFNGTSLNAVFGAITLDLRDAIINHDVEINASCVFAGIDIYIPRGVQIKTNNVPIFGGVSNKSMSSHDPGAPTIYLNSTCMFGGIDIK
ncbi:hypothetical protein I5677_05985 [Mobilitalea sibirica]|uniref:LiaF transmembrane domain-containing protein n=1 Tax=Mobilitalea sibirica TaxID=1462919 RepID=A0A8J7KSM9_9FIRM|nr:LiaF domain-containing protein [Mobilitalea sibirica]MBH1940446.1 hypothetical protein [Mobilitalea sibirica]